MFKELNVLNFFYMQVWYSGGLKVSEDKLSASISSCAVFIFCDFFILVCIKCITNNTNYKSCFQIHRSKKKNILKIFPTNILTSCHSSSQLEQAASIVYAFKNMLIICMKDNCSLQIRISDFKLNSDVTFIPIIWFFI